MKQHSIIAMLLSAAIIFGGCASMNNTGKGAAIGAGSGALLGAGIGALAGKGKGAAIGAAIGTAVGAGTGVLIGRKMDKQKKELEALENARIETVTDANNLQAIKITFESGILFPTNGTSLSASSKNDLDKFARSLRNSPDTDVTIFGHTDNTGTYEVNQRISRQRAESVADFLVQNGIARNRLTTTGKAYDEPVADNATAAGKAQNRRVEIYITANEKMIQDAESGRLN
ncbi:MAG: OmpA family protein [Odoribacteraceae bacterium]|jgi:outer membrane protein OmpA-like peptidoglycan-associated protein|nr:OmpA family protein [Odoribacteraceae bacterium]